MLRILSATFFFFISCHDSAGKDIFSKAPSGWLISITINENSLAIMGRDTLHIIEIADELRTRLWKSFLGTGRMPDGILLEYSGNVPSETKLSAEKAIKEAQGKTLTDVCLQKHKKKFEELSGSQKKKINRRFPVLFQRTYLLKS